MVQLKSNHKKWLYLGVESETGVLRFWGLVRLTVLVAWGMEIRMGILGILFQGATV